MLGSANPLRSRLRPGERVLWEGQPAVWAYSMRGAWFLIPFFVLWGGFAIFWEIQVISSGAPPFFALWGILFVTIGLYMIFGRILVARREASKTFYAITDRRVLIQAGAFRSTLTEFDLRDLPATQLDEHPDGSGTITLGPNMGFRSPPGWPMGAMYGRTPALEAIPGVGRVYETLQNAKAAAREAGESRS